MLLGGAWPNWKLCLGKTTYSTYDMHAAYMNRYFPVPFPFLLDLMIRRKIKLCVVSGLVLHETDRLWAYTLYINRLRTSWLEKPHSGQAGRLVGNSILIQNHGSVKTCGSQAVTWHPSNSRHNAMDVCTSCSRHGLTVHVCCVGPQRNPHTFKWRLQGDDVPVRRLTRCLLSERHQSPQSRSSRTHLSTYVALPIAITHVPSKQVTGYRVPKCMYNTIGGTIMTCLGTILYLSSLVLQTG